MPVRSILSQPWFGPAMIAAAVWLMLAATVDPAGSYPDWPEGPGLTVDEMFNVEQGVYLVEAVRHYGLGLLDLRSVREVFGAPAYLPDHPPLGRFWLGVHHHLTWAIAPPRTDGDPGAAHDVSGLPAARAAHPVTACARTGSATAFALTILLIGWFVGRQYGPYIGALAAVLLPLMPRLWGHAHLASLETITNLMCTAAVLSIAAGWNKATPPSARASLIAGLVLGLAFLTKIQAILLPIPIIVWALWRWRTAALKPLAIWAVTAAIVFFIGWPWLWLDPAENFLRYFARTTDRAELSVWYFGVKYADAAAPWTYPWVLFLCTLPMATLVLGVRGALFGVANDRTPSDVAWRALIAANVIFPLIVFSLPGVAVYDAERLFLTVFPFWAMLAARGAQFLAARFPRSRGVACCFALLISLQAWNAFTYRPCQLSFYNTLVGSLRGAEKRGLETTYWGDSVTRSLLTDVVQQVPAGGTVHVAPVLHQFQLDDLLRQSPILRGHGIRLVPYAGPSSQAKFLLLYRRRADLPPELRNGPLAAERLAEVRRKGVQLSALYRMTP